MDGLLYLYLEINNQHEPTFITYCSVDSCHLYYAFSKGICCSADFFSRITGSIGAGGLVVISNAQ
jgi:hypothetical protein